ncbi:MAG: class I SAM-dependent methyltransferase [bacterium]
MDIKDHIKHYRDEYHTGREIDAASINHHRIFLKRIDGYLTSGRGLIALDLGCDLGQFQPALSERFDLVLAADISATAAKKAAAMCPNSAGVCLDGERGVPFGNSSLDAIFAFGVLEHMHNPEAAISEFNRVLKPSGTLVMLQLYRLDDWAILYEKINRLRRRDAAGRATREDLHISQYRPAQWVKSVSDYGFELQARVATSVLPPLYYIGDTRFGPLRAMGNYLRMNFYNLPVLSFLDRGLCRIRLVANLAALGFIFVFRAAK